MVEADLLNYLASEVPGFLTFLIRFSVFMTTLLMAAIPNF